MGNALYYGDNLAILSRYVSSGSVDLVYLDPPFNSDASYNVLFRSPSGTKPSAQLRAFHDTWHWAEEAAEAYDQVMQSGSGAAAILRALRSSLGENDLMAYLSMMTIRLIHMRRVLKDTGSLYLHCDPTASHYLKIILDGIFGAGNFQSEIIWRRTTSRSSTRRWPRVHDVLLHFAKNADRVFFQPVKAPIDAGWLESNYRHEDERGRFMTADLTAAGTRNGPSGLPWRGIDPAGVGAGRHWRYTPDKLDELDRQSLIYWPATGRYPKLKHYLTAESGTVVGDLWLDIQVLGRTAAERLGYATQKPLSLLKRIITASCPPGGTVLDPFCGCGTAIHAAHQLGRNWIGIDLTHLAIQVIEDRFTKHFPNYKMPKAIGRPYDAEAARDLARRDKYQFQWWATWLVGGWARDGEKKGADRGVDGDIYFSMGRGRDGHGVISVKGGANVGPQMLRDLKGVREREGADVALFVSLAAPTAEMIREAASGGFVETPIGPVPRIQIYTIEELLSGVAVQLPPVHSTVTAAEAARQRKPSKPARRPSARQREMLFPIAGEAPLLEAAESAAAYETERRQLTRRRRRA